MKVTVIGAGYVGLVTAVCLADMGNSVWCVDIDKKRIDSLKKNEIPIFEPGLEDMVIANQREGRLIFTANLEEALPLCDICFIAVGTPMGEDGGADLRCVLNAAERIGRYMTRYVCVADKSTVPVGTAAKVRESVQRELDKRGSGLTFDVVSNPEFLKEGAAIGDCMKPDRIVIGADSEKAVGILKELLAPFVMSTENFIVMDVASAEMTKYAANAMLASRISFMNEIANICERVGADVNKVRMGIGSDPRIGYKFIFPGCGYGGSCFPKDVEALIRFAGEGGYDAGLLRAVRNVNDNQKHVMARKVRGRFGDNLSGFKFAVWGMSFKPDTSDMRESAAITIIDDLTAAGADIAAYDPKAIDEARKYYLKGNGKVTYTNSKYDAVEDADAMILVTEWKEFRSPDFSEMKTRMKTPIIFDGRNQYDAKQTAKHGFEYYQIGVGAPKR